MEKVHGKRYKFAKSGWRYGLQCQEAEAAV